MSKNNGGAALKGAQRPQIILTGIKPTGQLHLGNFVGAVRPFLKLAQSAAAFKSFLFIADCHSLTEPGGALSRRSSIRETAAALLALGADHKKTALYLQSAVPETMELAWILSSIAPKGLFNRAHSYKAKKAENEAKGKPELDDGVFMGLYSYPALMAADILLLSATHVPVGGDQLQHLEITKALAKKFRYFYKKNIFTVPQAASSYQGPPLPGLDGRKMSKSYNNAIPLFAETKTLKKLIMKIQTDSLPEGSPKDPEKSSLFQLFEAFSPPKNVPAMRERYLQGVSYGEAKESLFEVLESFLKPKREAFQSFLSQPEELGRILNEGAERARERARPLLKEVKKAAGLCFAPH